MRWTLVLRERRRRRRKTHARTYVDVVGVDVVRVGVSQERVELDSVAVVWDIGRKERCWKRAGLTGGGASTSRGLTSQQGVVPPFGFVLLLRAVPAIEEALQTPADETTPLRFWPPRRQSTVRTGCWLNSSKSEGRAVN